MTDKVTDEAIKAVKSWKRSVMPNDKKKSPLC